MFFKDDIFHIYYDEKDDIKRKSVADFPAIIYNGKAYPDYDINSISGIDSYLEAVDNNDDGVMKEWFEQSAAFSAHVVGMTAEEVSAMTTQAAKGHDISTDAELLAAGCSMQITGIKAVVAQAATNAR